MSELRNHSEKGWYHPAARHHAAGLPYIYPTAMKKNVEKKAFERVQSLHAVRQVAASGRTGKNRVESSLGAGLGAGKRHVREENFRVGNQKLPIVPRLSYWSASAAFSGDGRGVLPRPRPHRRNSCASDAQAQAAAPHRSPSLPFASSR